MLNAAQRRRLKWLKINLAEPLRGIRRNSREHLEAIQRRTALGLPASVVGDCEYMPDLRGQKAEGQLGLNNG